MRQVNFTCVRARMLAQKRRQHDQGGHERPNPAKRVASQTSLPPSTANISKSQNASRVKRKLAAAQSSTTNRTALRHFRFERSTPIAADPSKFATANTVPYPQNGSTIGNSGAIRRANRHASSQASKPMALGQSIAPASTKTSGVAHIG